VTFRRRSGAKPTGKKRRDRAGIRDARVVSAARRHRTVCDGGPEAVAKDGGGGGVWANGGNVPPRADTELIPDPVFVDQIGFRLLNLRASYNFRGRIGSGRFTGSVMPKQTQ